MALKNIFGSKTRTGRTPLLTVGLVATLIALFLSGCSRASQPSEALSPGGGWRQFAGTWIASGTRNNLRLEGDHQASIANFDGSLVLSGSTRPAVGFRAEALVFSDTTTGLVGRAVWTDERGDKVYSDLKEGGQGGTIDGTITGGTGRYDHATGAYEFSWRFLIDNEGTVQGQSNGLKGRIRVGSGAAAQTFWRSRS